MKYKPLPQVRKTCFKVLGVFPSYLENQGSAPGDQIQPRQYYYSNLEKPFKQSTNYVTNYYATLTQSSYCGHL